jgi:hypothetical protein
MVREQTHHQQAAAAGAVLFTLELDARSRIELSGRTAASSTLLLKRQEISAPRGAWVTFAMRTMDH